GNLLAWEGSVYSVTPFRINKYPDLGRGYEQALARHRENPADASRSVRLAALELLLHRPQKALDALARVDDGLRERDRRQFENVIQLRVRAMLDLVREGKLEASAAEKLLQE